MFSISFAYPEGERTMTADEDGGGYCEGLKYDDDAIRIRMKRTSNNNQYFR